jgi:hypothetical protein
MNPIVHLRHTVKCSRFVCKPQYTEGAQGYKFTNAAHGTIITNGANGQDNGSVHWRWGMLVTE